MFNKIEAKYKANPSKFLGEVGGYAGMALLQGATLPQIFRAIGGDYSSLAPLDMVLMVWVGLLLYFIRAYVQRDFLYMISNGIGLVCNLIVLSILVFGGA